MGHLRVHCPNKISKPYPFNDVLVSSAYIGVNEHCDEVCSPQMSKVDHSKASRERSQTCDVHVGDAMQCHGSGEGSSNHSSDANDLGFIDIEPTESETTEFQKVLGVGTKCDPDT